MNMFSFDSISRDLEATLYAAHIRGILLYHITVLQKAISYGALAKATSSMPSGGQLAQALTRIAEHDHSAGKPLSTAIVVREDTGIPGVGFFNQCRKLGYDIIEDPAEEWNFWRKILAQLGVEAVGDPDPIGGLLHRPLSSKDEISMLSSLWKVPEVDGSVDDLDSVFPKPSDEEDRSLVTSLENTSKISSKDRVGATKQVLVEPLKAVPERRQKVPEKVLLPVTQLAKGDIVWLSGYASPMTVDEVFSEGSTFGMIRWKNTAEQIFETPADSHLKVSTPARLDGVWPSPPQHVTDTLITTRLI